MERSLTYMHKDTPVAHIRANFRDRTVHLTNFISDPLKLPFGIHTNPTMGDLDNLINSRVMPKARDGRKEFCEYLGIADDDWAIFNITHGFMH